MARRHVMLNALFVASVLAAGAFLWWRNARQPAPAKGQPAPGFILADGQGRPHRLEDYRGRWLVLYFYPRDDTPGCTAEACGLRDNWTEFARRDVAVLGLSLDPPDRHAGFGVRLRLPFPLLSDPAGGVARRYAALWDFGLVRFARRHTFLIDPGGRVAHRFTSVSPGRHALEILAVLDQMRLEGGPGATNNPDMTLR